jgi:hypothetical protein
MNDDPLILSRCAVVWKLTVTPVAAASRGRKHLTAEEERNEQFATVITDLGMPYVD